MLPRRPVKAISLSRAAGPGRAAAPVRLVHLGLGNFFRAHQCWYTDRAAEAAGWGSPRGADAAVVAAVTDQAGQLERWQPTSEAAGQGGGQPGQGYTQTDCSAR